MRLPKKLNWYSEAACRGMEPELFHPTEPPLVPEEDPGLRTCAWCEVWLKCRTYAREERLALGTWGRETQWQRRRVLRLRNKQRKRNPNACHVCESEMVVQVGTSLQCLDCKTTWPK